MRGGRPPGVALERVAFGPLRARRPARAGRRTGALAARRVESAAARCAERVTRCRAPCACSPCAAPPPSTANEAAADPRRATEELMHEILERNGSPPSDVVSCIFTLHATTSTPSSRPSPRARSASTACRCCAPGRSPCPGSLPRVIRVLIHYYATSATRPRTSTCGEARGAAPGPRRRAVGSAPMAARVRRSGSAASRSTRPPTATRSDGRRAAGLQRVARPAAARRSSRPCAARLARRQPLPRPDERRAARRARATATACPAQRIAIGNGSCDVLLAAGEALLEPGRRVRLRVAVVLVYPHLAAASGATRGHRPAERRPRATTSTRWPRRSPSRRAS